MKLKHTFYNDVERDMKYVKYGDTDSLYINIPSCKPKTTKEAVANGFEISTLINKAIKKYVDETLIQKMGISAEHNQIDFKTELIIESFMLLDVKKNYAYKLLAKEGNILAEPEIEYTGIPVVKTDSPKFTQQFIRELIEDIALNNELDKQSMREAMNKLATEKHKLMNDAVDNFNFNLIGTPKKWGSRRYEKDPFQVTGMKLWNTINGVKFFTPASAGLHVSIKILRQFEFEKLIEQNRELNDCTLGKTTFSLLKSVVVPYKYDINQLKELFEKFHISIDRKAVWERLYNKTCERIIELIKTL